MLLCRPALFRTILNPLFLYITPLLPCFFSLCRPQLKHGSPVTAFVGDMSTSTPNRRSRLFALATGRSQSSHQALTSPGGLSPAQHTPRASFDRRSPSPSNYTDPFTSSHGHDNRVQGGDGMDDLLPPQRPFSHVDGGGSGLSSRRSSFSDKDGKERPPSLSLNYLPSKFTKKHNTGQHLHKRAKQGGGRDAFARNASRMGMMGTVDDDEGVVFQLGKGGLKKKKPKLRWNRFKWILFGCNTAVSRLLRWDAGGRLRRVWLTPAHLVWTDGSCRFYPRVAERVQPIRRDQSGQPNRVDQ